LEWSTAVNWGNIPPLPTGCAVLAVGLEAHSERAPWVRQIGEGLSKLLI